MKRESRLKNVEVRLIAELMKNSRRSDRELARVTGVAQPTVSRTIKKLEHAGIIKEYTIVPDFQKLGYEIMGITTAKIRTEPSKEELEKIRKVASELDKNNPSASLMAVSGLGRKSDRAFITFYKDYSDYTRAMKLTKQIPLLDADNLDTFLVRLDDETNYRILSMSAIAQHLLKENTEKAQQSK